MAVILWLCKAIAILGLSIIAVLLLSAVIAICVALGVSFYEAWKKGG